MNPFGFVGNLLRFTDSLNIPISGILNVRLEFLQDSLFADSQTVPPLVAVWRAKQQLRCCCCPLSKISSLIRLSRKCKPTRMQKSCQFLLLQLHSCIKFVYLNCQVRQLMVQLERCLTFVCVIIILDVILDSGLLTFPQLTPSRSQLCQCAAC